MGAVAGPLMVEKGQTPRQGTCLPSGSEQRVGGGPKESRPKNPGTGPQGEQAPPEGRRPLQRGNSEGAITRKDTTRGGGTPNTCGARVRVATEFWRLHAWYTKYSRLRRWGEDYVESDATPHPKEGLPNECPKSGEKIMSQNLQKILPENLQ